MFENSGTLRRAVFFAGWQSDERAGFVGIQHGFDEAGALVTEDAYDKGVLARRKLYKDGRLVLDEQYYADGSRK